MIEENIRNTCDGCLVTRDGWLVAGTKIHEGWNARRTVDGRLVLHCQSCSKSVPEMEPDPIEEFVAGHRRTSVSDMRREEYLRLML